MQDNIYSRALMDHVAHPDFNYTLDDATHTERGINASCGDDLNLMVRINDGIIEEVAWTGEGCAVSKASADMLSDLVADMTIDEALDLIKLFEGMIVGTETDDDLLEEKLDEALCLRGISRMPARVKCAELGWRTLERILKQVQSEA